MAAATQDNGDVEKTEPVGAQEAALVASPETQTEPPIKAVSKDHVGAKAWLDMFGSFMISAVCYGMTNSFGAFQEYYGGHQLSSYSKSDISWIGSAQLCLVLLLGCVSGPLFDSGYLRSQLICGGALYVFSLMMTSIAKKFYQIFLAQGLGVGLALGTLFAPSLSTLGHHFSQSKYRALAFGVFAAGASVGGAVFPVMLRQLFASVGFGWAVRILGLIVLFCILCGVCCLSTTLPPRKDIKILSFSVFRDMAYSLVVLGAGLVGLGLYGPVSFGVTYAVSQGMSTDLAYSSLTALNAVSIVGRIVPNAAAMVVGPINVLIIACLLSALMQFLWTTAQSDASIMAYNVLYGIMSGAYVAALPASIVTLGKDPTKTGLYLGMMFFATSFFWLAGSPITAQLIINDDYLPASLFGGLIVLLGVGTMAAGRVLIVREKKTQWV